MYNDQDDDWADAEYDDAGGDDPDDGLDVVPCPHCGADVHEDAQRCPACGDWIVHGSTSPWEGKPPWYVLLGLLGTIAVILVLSGLWRLI